MLPSFHLLHPTPSRTQLYRSIARRHISRRSSTHDHLPTMMPDPHDRAHEQDEKEEKRPGEETEHRGDMVQVSVNRGVRVG